MRYHVAAQSAALLTHNALTDARLVQDLNTLAAAAYAVPAAPLNASSLPAWPAPVPHYSSSSGGQPNQRSNPRRSPRPSKEASPYTSSTPTNGQYRSDLTSHSNFGKASAPLANPYNNSYGYTNPGPPAHTIFTNGLYSVRFTSDLC